MSEHKDKPSISLTNDQITFKTVIQGHKRINIPTRIDLQTGDYVEITVKLLRKSTVNAKEVKLCPHT